jgi:hypothetical protein
MTHGGRRSDLPDVLSDEEWALRAWLRAQTWTVDTFVAMGLPKGPGKFPTVEIVGRIGGGPEAVAPIDRPRVSFGCWGGPGGNGRSLAVTARNDLVGFLHTLEESEIAPATEDGPGPYVFTAYDITALWVPDETDPNNPLARYVVDATLAVRSA